MRELPRLSIFIATAPRSGSWLLAEGLRGLNVAGRAEEFFRVDLETTYRERWQLAPAGPFAEFLVRVLAEGQTANGVFATKVHWFQFAYLLRRLRALDAESPVGSADRSNPRKRVGDVQLLERYFGPVRMVHLEREDTLRQAISWQRAMRTDEWWSVAGADVRPGPTCGEYDFDAIKHLYYLLQDYKAKWRGWFAVNQMVPTDLAYEALAADYRGSLLDVLAGLGLPAPEVVPPPYLQRQADAETESWVRAYEQSWTRLFGSELQRT